MSSGLTIPGNNGELLSRGYEEASGGPIEYSLLEGSLASNGITVTDPQSRLVSPIEEVERGVYEATLTGGWGSYAADQCVSLTWPVLDPHSDVPDAEDEWTVSHRLWDMKPQITTDNAHCASGVINRSLLTAVDVTGSVLGFQAESSQKRITVQGYLDGVLTQGESSTNVPAIRGVEQHVTRLGRNQMNQSPPAICMDSWGNPVTTLFNSFTARVMDEGTQLFHCIQLGRNSAANVNSVTIRFRLYTRVDLAYKRRFQGIKMEGAPLNVWLVSDSIFSGYPDSKGMPYALQQLQLNPNLARKVRPIRYQGTILPGSYQTWPMNGALHDALNGARASEIDANFNTTLASVGQVDVFILCAGVNDIIDGVPTSTIIASLQSIVDKFNVSANKNPGCKVYVTNRVPGINPVYATPISDLNAAILNLTGTDGFIDQFTGWDTSTMSIPGDGHPSYPDPYTNTPDYTYGTWYQAKRHFEKIFGFDPGV